MMSNRSKLVTKSSSLEVEYALEQARPHMAHDLNAVESCISLYGLWHKNEICSMNIVRRARLLSNNVNSGASINTGNLAISTGVSLSI